MNFLYQVKESVIDFKFYKTIKDNTFAKSFLYLLLLLLIIYSMLTAKNYIFVKNVLEQASFQINQTLPDFQLKDGKFSFEGEMPYYLTSSTNEVFIVDTTGTVNEATLQGVLSGILITENNMYIKNGNQQQTLNFSEMKNAAFSKQDLVDRLPGLSLTVLIFMLLWFVFALLGHLLFAMFLALIGLAISSKYNTDLKFKHLLNFSIYALTLPMFLDLAVDVASVPFLLGFGSNIALGMFRQLIYFGIYTAISIVYIAYAIKAYNNDKNHPELAEDNNLI